MEMFSCMRGEEKWNPLQGGTWYSKVLLHSLWGKNWEVNFLYDYSHKNNFLYGYSWYLRVRIFMPWWNATFSSFNKAVNWSEGGSYLNTFPILSLNSSKPECECTDDQQQLWNCLGAFRNMHLRNKFFCSVLPLQLVIIVKKSYLIFDSNTSCT